MQPPDKMDRQANPRQRISVVICTHNPRAHYLARVLDALKSQTLPRSEWELLVIDNASAEPLSGRVPLDWHPRSRIVAEAALGLTPARLRGISESRESLLVFVDDDNVLDARFLEAAREVAEQHPHLGAFSGQAIPEFERPPEDWTRRYWGSLAIRQFEQDRWSNLPFHPETTPMGAGLCVRRAVATRYRDLHDRGLRPIRLDRAGSLLVSGGDVDLAMTACELGMGTGVFASLRLAHLMPPERLKEPYLLRLIEGIAYSGVILDHFIGRGAHDASPALRTRLANIVRWVLMTPRERRFLRAQRRGEQMAVRQLREQRVGATPRGDPG